MKAIITLTHILFPILVGLTIGGVVSGEGSLVVWGLALIAFDIIVGTTLQYLFEKSRRDAWNKLSPEEKIMINLIHQEIERDAKGGHSNARVGMNVANTKSVNNTQTKRNVNNSYDLKQKRPVNTMKDNFEIAYYNLTDDVSRRVTLRNTEGDDAVNVLLDLCHRLEHAPLWRTMIGLYEVYAEEVGGFPAIVYSFHYSKNSICENVLMYIVLDKKSRLRLFALETDYSRFMLCEYYENRHKNYGVVSLDGVNEAIAKIIST